MIRLVLLSLVLLAAPASWAQSGGHVLSIHDGVVALDGEVLPDAVPATLDLTGIDLDFEFVGPVTPVISIDGQPYVFEDRRLVPLQESSREGETVYPLGQPPPSSGAPASRLVQMGEAAYLQQVAARDAALYRQIEAEQAMEAEAMQRAARIRQMAEGPERAQEREALRTLLSDLLQLKDANRRAEIARAQERLDAVRAQLDDRAAMHDAIVDARLKALCDK